MDDQISQYRTVRLVLHVPSAGYSRTEWALHLTRVNKGIPDTAVVARGAVSMEGGTPSLDEIVGALAEAVRHIPATPTR